MFNLSNPSHSYIFGFLLTDGHLERSGTKGKVRIEISNKDVKILEQIKITLSMYKSTLSFRERKTNFGPSISAILSFYGKNFRDILEFNGMTSGKKSAIINVPKGEYSPKDFWRGIIDGDGSLGITQKKLPFVSLMTASEELALSFKQFVFQTIGYEIKSERNKRDNVHNLMLMREEAQQLIKILYYENCMCLDRKMIKAKEVCSWIRPSGLIRKKYKDWTSEDDDYISSNSIVESMKYLKRTRNSIATRLWRIRTIKQNAQILSE